MTSPQDFTSIPILDFSLSQSPSTKPEFLRQLRLAAINVGFLYLSNTTVSSSVTQEVVDYIPQLFALPQAEKDEIRMRNSPHFLGYSKFGAEFTKGAVDQREQFDIATEHECQWKEGEPEYLKLWGPSQVSFPLTAPFLCLSTGLMTPRLNVVAERIIHSWIPSSLLDLP
jgi:isopenicillin N synthase-like dioxygenase